LGQWDLGRDGNSVKARGQGQKLLHYDRRNVERDKKGEDCQKKERPTKEE